MTHKPALSILGGISADEFLANYWQKKPLFIKQAIPNFKGLLSPNELAGLACEDNVQSRIVEEVKGEWYANHGPFDDDDFARLPDTPTADHRWTLLVQSVNHHLPEASALLQQFNFIPHARLDDLMVSYAPEGGGVGPHFDSYDVFLLQGQGKRLWRISEQTDLEVIEGAPLRILKRFDTAKEWLVEAGDLLYLPPHLAHWGIAVSDGADDCMTYSVGFRAPKHQELATEFLGFMQDKLNQDKLTLTGIYQDSDLTLQNHPAEISNSMITKVSEILQQIQWTDHDITEFLGTYLSTPKMDVIFDAHKKIPFKVFSEKCTKLGLALDLKTQMLFAHQTIYINGELFTGTKDDFNVLEKLADHRQLKPADLILCKNEQLLKQLYDWYLSGYLNFGAKLS